MSETRALDSIDHLSPPLEPRSIFADRPPRRQVVFPTLLICAAHARMRASRRSPLPGQAVGTPLPSRHTRQTDLLEGICPAPALKACTRLTAPSPANSKCRTVAYYCMAVGLRQGLGRRMFLTGARRLHRRQASSTAARARELDRCPRNRRFGLGSETSTASRQPFNSDDEAFDAPQVTP